MDDLAAIDRYSDTLQLAALIGRFFSLPARIVIAALALAGLIGCQQGSSVPDGSPAPIVRRIVTLSPHLTELVYAAGAGGKLVGVVEYSDYPPAAMDLPRVGDAFRIDYERIAELSPDLILGWRTGNPVSVIERLRDLGYQVEVLDAARLDDVARQLVAIGVWSGTEDSARQVALEYRNELARIRDRYLEAKPVSVFYQISAQPFFTISNQHTIGEAIRLCGGTNIFGELQGISPAVSLEAIIDRAPQVIVVGTTDENAGARGQIPGLSQWDTIPAIRMENIVLVDADFMTRPSVRILQGIRQLCEGLDRARARMDG